MLEELNKKYEEFSKIQDEYIKGIHKFFSEITECDWLPHPGYEEVIETSYFLNKERYEFQYWFGSTTIVVYHVVNYKTSYKDISIDEFIKLYKKLKTFEKFQ